MIIARIESLICGIGLEDALSRAQIYIKGGADGILIHSIKERPDEVLMFAREYQKLCHDLNVNIPLVSVPTTYNMITDQQLAAHGFSIIIHANHLLRAAHKAMQKAAETILNYDRNFEVNPFCSPVQEISKEVGFEWIKKQDKQIRIGSS